MSVREPTYVERDQGRLTVLLPGWRIWTVDMTVGGITWHAMPHGAETAVCNAHSPDELVAACKAWDAPAYLAKTQAELDAAPEDSTRLREMLAANILAAGRLLAGAAKP